MIRRFGVNNNDNEKVTRNEWVPKRTLFFIISTHTIKINTIPQSIVSNFYPSHIIESFIN